MRPAVLELRDFQAHKRLRVQLAPTITTLRGPTDVGKSAVLRALRWLCLNDIAGDEFIREGAKETIVTLEVDGHVIRRIRGSRDNVYELDGKEYRAFGTSVPNDIARILQLNEINFQGQHDGPFWFNESAPEVSRRLNAVIDLSVIDQVLSNIASEVAQARTRVQLTTERLEEASSEYEEAKPQAVRIEDFENLVKCHETFAEAKEDRDLLDSIGRRASQTRERVRELEEQAADGDKVLAAAREALDLDVQHADLKQILEDAAEEAARAAPPPDFSPVEEAFDKWQEAEREYNRLEKACRQLVNATTAETNGAEKLRTSEARFHKEIKGQRCPLCNQSL